MTNLIFRAVSKIQHFLHQRDDQRIIQDQNNLVFKAFYKVVKYYKPKIIHLN